MMKTMTIPTLFAATVLSTGSAFAAGTNGGALPAGEDRTAPIQIAAASQDTETGFADEKKAVEETFESWVDQLAKHAEQADENAESMASDASEALDEAWAEVRASWEDVKAASEDNWEEAKAKFDQSISRLEAAWDDLQGG